MSVMNVLINAFAIGPYQGSEPGIGWRWITHIAKHCNVYVICGDEYKDDVLVEYEKFPYKKNLKLFFNPIPPKVVEIVNNQGDWRFYYYYRQWQKKALEIAMKICQDNKIDIIHQLNLTGYREPGYLWKIKGPKYVWGPVGGTNLCPVEYIKGIDSKTTNKYRLKNLFNRIQFRIEPRIKKAAKRADLIFCDGAEGVQLFKQVYGVDSVQINETGCVVRSDIKREKTAGSGDGLELLWAGRFLPTKLLDLAFWSLSLLEENFKIKMHILGSGNNEETYRAIANKLGVNDRIVWHGQVSHDEVEHLMRSSDLFFFTSVVEGTPSVIMECISNGLPILCFDRCGFGPLVDESIGDKILLSTPEKSAHDFAERIRYFYNHRDELAKKSENCKERLKTISWDALTERLLSLYNEILKNKE